MASIFDNILNSEPHSIEEIRSSLDTAAADEKKFIPLLKQHHDFLEESIAVLMDRDATDAEKQNHLMRFFRLLEMHGKAEQETLYINLKQNADKEARLEGFGGQDEHDVAFQLEHELLRMGYLKNWNEEIAAKAKVVASLVKNHMKEEEDVMFSVAEKDLSDAEIEMMRIDYLKKCKAYLDNTTDLSKPNEDMNEELRFRDESPAVLI